MVVLLNLRKYKKVEDLLVFSVWTRYTECFFCKMCVTESSFFSFELKMVLYSSLESKNVILVTSVLLRCRRYKKGGEQCHGGN